MELSLGNTVPRRWKQIWDKSDANNLLNRIDQLEDRLSFGLLTSRSHGQMSHKRSTVDLLVKGKLLGQATKALGGQAHHFERYNFTTPATCDYCSLVLWGLLKTGMYILLDCCLKFVNFSLEKILIIRSLNNDSSAILVIRLPAECID